MLSEYIDLDILNQRLADKGKPPIEDTEIWSALAPENGFHIFGLDLESPHFTRFIDKFMNRLTEKNEVGEKEWFEDIIEQGDLYGKVQDLLGKLADSDWVVYPELGGRSRSAPRDLWRWMIWGYEQSGTESLDLPYIVYDTATGELRLRSITQYLAQFKNSR